MPDDQSAGRVQRKRSRGWSMPADAVCVDRSTGFGNPFPIIKGTMTSTGVKKPTWQVGTWEGPAMWFRDTREEAQQLAVDAYRAWVMAPSQDTLREKARLTLKGKRLACWCSLDKPCHADVLLEIANGK